jgi:cellobiose-specific phosphotransferase system component IIA
VEAQSAIKAALSLIRSNDTDSAKAKLEQAQQLLQAEPSSQSEDKSSRSQ